MYKFSFVDVVQIELESWDSWGRDDRGDFSQMKSGQNNSLGGGGNRFPNKMIPDPEPELEKDYFQELQLEPSISRTKKVGCGQVVKVFIYLSMSMFNFYCV